MRHKGGRGAGNILIYLGAVLLLCALGLFLYNRDTDRKAGEEATEVLQQIGAAANSLEDGADKLNCFTDETYRHNPDMEMPVICVDGVYYIGTLALPALEIELPVISAWSDAALQIAPCRYAGSAYRDDLVIAAHNYRSHFGRIHTLSAGDPVRFTDADGHVFSYTVAATEILSPYSVDAVQESEWALTLFTCTYGGQYRVAVRCLRTT